MRIYYTHETQFPWDCKIGQSMFLSHEKWVRQGIDDLKEDILYIFSFEQDFIYNKIDSSKSDAPIYEELKDKKILRINFPIKPNTYPIELKNNSSIITCGKGSTFTVLYFGKITNDLNKMKLKYNLVPDSILEIGKEIYGKDIKLSKGKNPRGLSVRNDIILNNKKFCGFDLIEEKRRFAFCSMIQNKYTEVEEKKIYKFMTGDPHWEKSYGNKIGITGINFDLHKFIMVLQKNADKIYLS